MGKIETYEKIILDNIKTKAVLSSELSDILVNKAMVTKINARKIISNMVKNGKLFSCDGLVFDSGAKLLYKKYDKDVFLNSLHRYKPYIKDIIYLLDTIHIVHQIEIYKRSSCIMKTDSKKYNLEKIIKELRVFRDFRFYKSFIVFNNISDTEVEEYSSLYEKINSFDMHLLATIINQDLKSNLISKDGLAYRSLNFLYPTYNGYVFDAVSKSKSLYGGVVFYEICINDDLSNESIDAYVKRVNSSIHSIEQMIIPVKMLIYNNCDINCINYAQSKGIITISIENRFGYKINMIREKYMKLNYIKDSSSINEILQSLNDSGLDGIFGNIKGELFERVVCSIIDKIYDCQGIIKTRQKKCVFNTMKDGGVNKVEHKEVDYLLKTAKETILVEMKSSKDKVKLGTFHNTTNSITKDSVKYFFNTVTKYKNHNPQENTKFIFFSANGFDSYALEFLKKQETIYSPLKYSVYFDLERVKKILLPLNDEIKIDCDTWERFFLNGKSIK